jgi:hypothetical protein
VNSSGETPDQKVTPRINKSSGTTKANIQESLLVDVTEIVRIGQLRFDHVRVLGAQSGGRDARSEIARDQICERCDDLRAFEIELYKFMETRYPQVFRGIVEKKQLDDQLKAALDAAVKEFAGDFASRKASAA